MTTPFGPDAQREIVNVGGKEWVVLRRGAYAGLAVDPRVRHYSYIAPHRLSHHRAPAGVHCCPLCDRLVIRGQGRWWESTRLTECPTCGSPEPRLHPATQSGGEVRRICGNPFHQSRP